LGDRLKSLEESGIISKGQDEIKKSRIKYSLTEKAIALLPMMIEMIIWSGTFDRETAAGDDFLELAKSNKTALLMNLTKKLTGTHLAQ
jgi:DNA-binding HxlR family transcriptional regulator